MLIYTREYLQTEAAALVEVDDFQFFHLGRIMVMNNHSVEAALRRRLCVRIGVTTRTSLSLSSGRFSRIAPTTGSLSSAVRSRSNP